MSSSVPPCSCCRKQPAQHQILFPYFVYYVKFCDECARMTQEFGLPEEPKLETRHD